jgi:membrane-bound lytic murein transglycosylase
MTATLPAHRDALLRMAVGFTGVLLLAACASTPPAPSASMQAAQRAISQAEGAEAGRYAPAELSEARAKLASADTASAEQKMTLAERFAEESRVEAELASAKTADVKARTMNDELMRSNGTLSDEMQRNPGDQR